MGAETCNRILLWCPVVYNIWTMIYCFMGLNWVIAGFVRGEVWVWAGLCNKKAHILLIPISIFWVVRKKRNTRAFDGVERDLVHIRDSWLHTFRFLFLGHDINGLDDFGNVIDHLSKFTFLYGWYPLRTMVNNILIYTFILKKTWVI